MSEESIPADFLKSGRLHSAIGRSENDLVGKRIGVYEITSLLGVGGMGEVYQARDTSLGRNVAIKVLPVAFVADARRLSRFRREAQLLAALNDPHIAAIHSIEEGSGIPALVLELVEGQTLADRLTKGPIPVSEALAIARQIAKALETAHAHGIIHRDLKPANIKVTPEGTVKVLDFGLAKEIPELEAGPERSSLSTAGTIVGTVEYMSPEQARGQTVDKRTDIWSFGCVLYEMFAGRQPFAADTDAEVLAKILEREPAFDELAPDTPQTVRALIRRCLEKNLSSRLPDISDATVEIEGALRSALTDAPRPNTSVRVGLAVGGVALIAVVAVLVVWMRSLEKAPTAEPPQFRFTQLTSEAGTERYPSLSPDGREFVYSAGSAGNEDVFLQSVGGRLPVNLTRDSPAHDWSPAFSPDGEQIAFRSERDGGGIFIMSRDGGSVKRLTPVGFNPAWTPDGKFVVYSTQAAANPEERGAVGEAWKVEVATERTTRISSGDCMDPSVSPNGIRVVCWGLAVTNDTPPRLAGGARDIVTVRLDGTDFRRLTDDDATDWSPVWSADGRHVFFASDRGGTMNLWHVAVDERSGKRMGDPEPLTTPATWLGHLTRSADGRRLAYTSYNFASNVHRVSFDPVSGAVQGTPVPITTGTLTWDRPEVSPDGTSLTLWSNLRQDVFYMRADGSGLRALTTDRFKDRAPRWSPDGKRIAFYSNRGGNFGFWGINPDSSGLTELVRAESRTLTYPVWSPDGSRVMASDLASRRNYIFAVGEKPATEPVEVLPPFPGVRFSARSWSRDGQKIAGVAPGAPGEVWVYTFGTGRYEMITEADTGHEGPVWLNDNRRILYVLDGRLMLVDAETKRTKEILSAAGEHLGGATLSSDNRHIYFTRGAMGADVWLMTLEAARKPPPD